MKILHFDSKEYNFITIDKNKYFIFKGINGKNVIIPDHCPHRGGPLHLGKWDEKKEAIICPWHRIACKKQYLIHNGLPAVRVGTDWHVLIDQLDVQDVSLQKLHIALEENLNKWERYIV
ncbi:MAG: hypothetical protein A3F11_07225 [Gammaproteobacteria bacterium RIFCSPHIGHO2_12_FULL_37_14]|nr:MAG: hypothetical protein A3F11_07225 [Gammaproteobacteria bacterium RIFCSPHIGHO2_12_FULL_37_14]